MHLGVYQRAFGTILQYPTNHKRPHGPERNLNIVWAELKAQYEFGQRGGGGAYGFGSSLGPNMHIG